MDEARFGGPHPYLDPLLGPELDEAPMDHVIDAVIEIFSWVGLGAGVLLGVVALILYLADGTWLPVRGRPGTG